MSAYEALETRFKQISSIDGASAILHWDAATMLPSGATAVRGDQLAALAEMSHERLTAPDMPALFSEAMEGLNRLGPWQSANLREMQHRYRHAASIPQPLVAALTRARITSEHVWREARATNNYAMFLPVFNEVLKLTREAANAKAEALKLSAYDAMLDGFDPGMRCAYIDPLFADLSSWLPAMVDEVIDHQAKQPAPLDTGPVPVAKQEALGRVLMNALGFDFAHGRIDTSTHPFCGGVPGDVRLTTRYSEERFAGSLYGVLHETGHALYELGLPEQWRGQPVADARGMSAHESQSLLIEMQLALSLPFLRFLVPLLQKEFGVSGPAWSPENLQRSLIQVERSFIRVDADEVTYPLHVMLRYDLEKKLLTGELSAEDLPDAWDAKFEQLLGVRPPDVAQGCLQDIHWPEGMIGYFPTYSLGAMLAAQLFAAFKAQTPNWAGDIEKGHFIPLVSWLKTHLHSKGSSLPTPELIQAATGSELSTAAFKAHLKERYLS